MKKQIKFSDKQLEEFKDVIVKSGRITVSNLQVRCGLGYQDAKLVFGILNEDKKLVAEVLKYQKEKPIIIKRYVDLAIKEIKKIKNKDYVNWDDISAKLGMKYEYDVQVKSELYKLKILSEDRIYLILKK